MRQSIMQALSQPNGRADEPWGVNGDFLGDDGLVYLALGQHQTEGDFWGPLIANAIQAGVEEITVTQYRSAQPQVEI